jgi:hypothetical protein
MVLRRRVRDEVLPSGIAGKEPAENTTAPVARSRGRRTARTLPVALLAGALLGAPACKANVDTGGQPSGRKVPVGKESGTMPAPDTCKEGSRNGQPLPDRQCTPGATNPDVKPSNIDDTICKVGWTNTVRPSSSVTRVMKAKSARSYGFGRDVQGEYDHLIPLELGGAPDDPRNLWLEPGRIPNPKDAVEHKLNDAVCSGLVPLAKAQHAIAVNWVTAYDDAGLRVSGGKVCLRADPGTCATGRHFGGKR